MLLNTAKKPCFLILMITILLCLSACDSNAGSTQAPPKIEQYDVSILAAYQNQLFSSNPICDIFIDGEKVFSSQASGSNVTIDIKLDEGKHTFMVQTNDWGLVTGTQSNKVEFQVSTADEILYMGYKKTLTQLKAWSSQTQVTVE